MSENIITMESSSSSVDDMDVTTSSSHEEDSGPSEPSCLANKSDPPIPAELNKIVNQIKATQEELLSDLVTHIYVYQNYKHEGSIIAKSLAEAVDKNVRFLLKGYRKITGAMEMGQELPTVCEEIDSDSEVEEVHVTTDANIEIINLVDSDSD